MTAFNLDGIKLSQLRALVAVAATGNFSEAALDLQLSQSAVSHAIASLENELGVTLFSRGRHGAHPTPVGERIISRAQQMLNILADIGREANLAKGLEGGEVRVATFRSVATHVLPDVIAQFRSDFPKVRVSITEHYDYFGVEQALREGTADVGLTYTPTAPDLEAWQLLQDEYIVLLPPDAAIAPGPLTWEDLAAFPMILQPPSDVCRDRVEQYFVTHGRRLKVDYDVREDSTIVGMVQRGLGATIMPRLAAEPVPSGVQVRSLAEPLTRIIGVAVLTNALHTPAAYAFLEKLRAIAQPQITTQARSAV